MSNVYSGVIEVEDGGFDLKANRLILRENQVAFDFSGSDEWGAFNIQGIAKMTESGFYMAPKLELIYPQYVNKDSASIKITAIDTATVSGKCKLRGSWLQANKEWRFSGLLSEYIA
jgi:hypothetical protein